ncbi:cellulase family glycosylhydrolase [Niabella aurantiaca]|uniref:cellulase family glycosylhydrolase n=1 Tax=Niabella aurantiaca TaxID=379900 RepID=UPI0008FBE350|nr:cellulase family glycosylhydrolase [Niabella aurantiaca]
MKHLFPICSIWSLAIMTLFFAACKRNNDISNDGGLQVINGNYLADGCGNRLVLRGVNMGSVYALDLGKKELTEIAQTGANAVRLVFTSRYTRWNNGTSNNIALTGAEIESLIKICISNNMIPVLELHDYTGSANPLADIDKAAGWWISADIKNVLMQYQRSIIVNIANEPDNGTGGHDALYNAYTKAVITLRNAGYTCPLMIDSYNWGKDPQFIVNKGRALMDHDPRHNLVFSVHTYWPTNGRWSNYSDAQITGYMNALKNANLPVTIGELARADVQNGVDYTINYRLLMDLCQQHGFGYLVWWWGFYNNPGSNNTLSMAPDGLYTGLHTDGKAMAITDAHSIQKTAKKPCKN